VAPETRVLLNFDYAHLFVKKGVNGMLHVKTDTGEHVFGMNVN
jgi:hypothetical protein